MQNRATFESCCAERGGKVSLAGLQRGGDGAGKTFMQFHLLKKFHLIERNGKIESSLFGECAAAVFKHSPIIGNLFTCTICTGIFANLEAFFRMYASSTNILGGADQYPNTGPSGFSQIYIDLIIDQFPFLNYPFTK